MSSIKRSPSKKLSTLFSRTNEQTLAVRELMIEPDMETVWPEHNFREHGIRDRAASHRRRLGKWHVMAGSPLVRPHPSLIITNIGQEEMATDEKIGLAN